MAASDTKTDESTGMEYARLGDTGLWVSRICLGGMNFGTDDKFMDWWFGEEESRTFIKRALELGINFFDTADSYSVGRGEEVLGRALKDFAKREEVIIATKVFHSLSALSKHQMTWTDNSGGLGRKHIFEACNASLKRLGTDYIDLYIIHTFDPHTPIKETMCALNDLVRSGKVHYIGASKMATWQFHEAQHIAEVNGWTKFISMQDMYNLTNREGEREMIPYCNYSGVGLTPFSPLAGGHLSGKRPKGAKDEDLSARAKSWLGRSWQATDEDHAIVERLKEVAEKHSVSPAQAALAWILGKPGVVSPVVGATKLLHLEEACKALAVKLTAEEVEYLEELYKPKVFFGMKMPKMPKLPKNM